MPRFLFLVVVEVVIVGVVVRFAILVKVFIFKDFVVVFDIGAGIHGGPGLNYSAAGFAAAAGAAAAAPGCDVYVVQ